MWGAPFVTSAEYDAACSQLTLGNLVITKASVKILSSNCYLCCLYCVQGIKNVTCVSLAVGYNSVTVDRFTQQQIAVRQRRRHV